MSTTDNEPRAANRKVATRSGSWSQKIESIDITLDVSVGVLRTLKEVAKISPLPFLSEAASIALAIFDVVQKMRSNKRRFEELAKDSCEIVCEIVGDIINARKDASQPGDVPIDLGKHLKQLVNVLRSIQEFAQKGASRNLFVAMLRYNTDARRIQDYQKKLYQALNIFGLHSHISVRKTVAELAGIPARVLFYMLLPILPDILRGTPNDTSRLVDLTLPCSENVRRKDNNGVTTHPQAGRRDNNFSELRAKYGILAL